MKKANKPANVPVQRNRSIVCLVFKSMIAMIRRDRLVAWNRMVFQTNPPASRLQMGIAANSIVQVSRFIIIWSNLAAPRVS